ncbi:hypothetical protein [Wolbachia endosymbiont (group A) of Myopa testacea]|uniref:hypothetical protein n=1 Tax=Wolbachia endosymbiont (group A) of Myopa testacea TaxID=3066148 RepID=UPI00333F2E67
MMEKCQKHTHFQTKAPYDKERFDLKLDQKFTTDQPNKVWVNDITYIKIKEGCWQQ